MTTARREARRADIVAAARRCFSRDGFHRTSMPDIAAEAGLSAGASYRYFASKEEIILEIAGDAFRVIFEPVLALVDRRDHLSVADLVAAAVEPISVEMASDAAGRPVPVEELLRCAVQAWGEILRHDGLQERALQGFDHVRVRLADALRRSQQLGTVSADLDPDRGARVVMALLHGFVVQRVAFGLDDAAGFTRDVTTLLADARPPVDALACGSPTGER